MRRVYYTYALRTAGDPLLLHGFLALGMLIALSYFVSIGDVLHNLAEAKVGHLGTYFYNAITNTEAWTLILLGVFIYAVISVRFSFRTAHRRGVGVVQVG